MDKIKKLLTEKLQRELETQTRRHFIQSCVSGLGGLALGSMVGCQAPNHGACNFPSETSIPSQQRHHPLHRKSNR